MMLGRFAAAAISLAATMLGLCAAAEQRFLMLGRILGQMGRPKMGCSRDGPIAGISAAERGLVATSEPPSPAATPHSIRSIRKALICFNPLQKWKIGFDGDLAVYDVRYTLMHEIGHAIGLDHPGAAGALMGFRYDEKQKNLTSGDIEAARSLYGTTSSR